MATEEQEKIMEENLKVFFIYTLVEEFGTKVKPKPTLSIFVFWGLFNSQWPITAFFSFPFD